MAKSNRGNGVYFYCPWTLKTPVCVSISVDLQFVQRSIGNINTLYFHYCKYIKSGTPCKCIFVRVSVVYLLGIITPPLIQKSLLLGPND